MFQEVAFLNHIFDIFYLYNLPVLYCYIFFRCIAKANYCGEDTAYCPYHSISKHSPCHVSDGQSDQRLVFEHGSFCLSFVTLKNWHFACFSPGTFHSPLSTLALTLRTHILTTVHTTQSHNSTPSLTKTSVCVSLKNINTEPSQPVGVWYTESYRLVSGLNSCTALRVERRKLYIITDFWNFTRVATSSFWWSYFETW